MFLKPDLPPGEQTCQIGAARPGFNVDLVLAAWVLGAPNLPGWPRSQIRSCHLTRGLLPTVVNPRGELEYRLDM